MRRKRLHSAENHDRWLVSYADFITLLFAFFVLMFASTQSDKSKARAVSQAIDKALKESSMTEKVITILGGTVHNRGSANALRHGPGGAKAAASLKPDTAIPSDLSKSFETLKLALIDDINKGDVRLTLNSRGLVIGLNAAAFFSLGGDDIHLSFYPTIQKLSDVLNRLPNALCLEGHTDSLPIRTPRFRSNWELSAARSIAMLRLLSEHFHVDSSRMSIVGYAEGGAISSNETEEGRSKNRRVDIVILSAAGAGSAPVNSEPRKAHSDRTTSLLSPQSSQKMN